MKSDPLAVTALALSLLCMTTQVRKLVAQESEHSVGADGSTSAKIEGVNLYVEEDLFLFNSLNLDRNYTGGASLQFIGTGPSRMAEAVVGRIDQGWMGLLGDEKDPHNWPFPIGSVTLALTAFTPDSLAAFEPIPDDRPYASLLAVMGRQTYLSRDMDAAWHTELSVGVLGLHLARNLQRWIHKQNRASTGRETPRDPKGWSHQVSDGGELTALYAATYERVVASSHAFDGAKWVETTLAAGGEMG